MIENKMIENKMIENKIKVIVFTLAVMTLLFSSCSRHPSKPERLNLLLITIDTLRADHLGCYGCAQVETPRIDRLARDGVIFSRAFTPVPITLPSHVSIFTGNYPPVHGVRNNGTFTLDQSAATLAEILKQNGYRTAAVVSSYTLDSSFGLDQGFEFYDDEFSQNKTGPSILNNERIGDKTSQRAIQWLNQHREEKFFLWLHYFDPHADYSPPEPFRTRYRKNPYDGEIAYTDQCLGEVLDALDQLHLMDNTLVVLTADHGEGLGEHAERTHTFFIYDSTLRVPLIFHCPAKFPRGRKVESLVRTIDIMPTIMEALNVQTASESEDEAKSPDEAKRLKVQGVSLYSAAVGDQDSSPDLDLDLYCESLYPKLNHNLSPLFGLRTRSWKYIQAPRPELYQLQNDPAETKNLLIAQSSSQAEQLKTEPSQTEPLRARLSELQKSMAASTASTGSNASNGGSPAEGRMTSEQKQRLESLGYVWSPGQSGIDLPAIKDLPDPKDFISLMDQADSGLSYYARGELVEAIEAFKKVLDSNPQDISTHFMLGLVYEKQKNNDLAIQEYQESVRLDPAYLDAHKQLGMLYAEKGDLDRAMTEFQEALRLNPKHKEAHNLLGGIYLWQQSFDQATVEIQKALELDPNFADAHFNLGLLYSRKKALSQAIREFQTALKIKPDYQAIHGELGDLYLMTGKAAQAEEELQKAVQLQPDQVKPRIHLGIAYYSLNKPEQAILEIQKALTLQPGNPEALFHLGVAYGQQGRTDKALEVYQQALKARPDYPEVYMNIGTIYFHQQALDPAIAAYKKAVKIAPGYAQAHFNLATAYDTRGMIDQAIAEYQETINLKPDFTQAVMLLQRAEQMKQQGQTPASTGGVL